MGRLLSSVAGEPPAHEDREHETQVHSIRVTEYALRLAREVGYPAEDQVDLKFGAMLHDIGKIGVQDSILLKPGPLTEEEWVEMRRHPIIGANIVEPLRLGRLVAPIVRGHHERWDGRGYPDGLARTAIPLGARVVGVVDAYDAMIHDRPYRRALSHDHARSELFANAGMQFDPELVRTFAEFLDARPDGSLTAELASDAHDLRTMTHALMGEPAAAAERPARARS